jgi:peptidoglycan/xylan/chitin deacetylase (PgdA/CDA1 family)
LFVLFLLAALLMVFSFFIMRRTSSFVRFVCLLLAVCCSSIALAAANCQRTLYLTLDTGSMSQAEAIAAMLRKYQIKASFFLANEKTWRGDWSLDPSWAAYWKSLVADGHVFGSHTWQHGKFRQDEADGRVRYVHMDGSIEHLDTQGVCQELNRVDH